jgi:iron(II)-dependent oxidoreductase
MTAEPYVPPREAHVPAGAERDGQMALVPGGPFEMGAGAVSAEGFSYDNERPRHELRLEPFLIDTTPVTNGDMIAFVEEGGYGRCEWWSDEGWAWRERESVSLPLYWRREAAGFAVRSFDEVRPVDPAHPTCHVSWYEADAFARYAGKRLPTEAEWEKAAAHDHLSGTEHRYPWGDDPPNPDRANLDQLAFGTAPAGAYLQGASAAGARQLLGDVWEWTASGFERYAGFKAFPYREYSEEFFGGPFRVLRGGSWATQPGAVTNTFRNWDYPERRQIFAGFRCAKDADA